MTPTALILALTITVVPSDTWRASGGATQTGRERDAVDSGLGALLGVSAPLGMRGTTGPAGSPAMPQVQADDRTDAGIGPDAPVRAPQSTIGGQDGTIDDAQWIGGHALAGGVDMANVAGWLYVHALDRPAVNVDGLDPQYLAESVPVARCESTHREAAVNPTSGTRGLLQIHPIHIRRIERLGYTWDDMLTAGPNLHVAASIHAEQGWRPWVSSRGCWGHQ